MIHTDAALNIYLKGELEEARRLHALEIAGLTQKLKQAHGWIRSALDNVLNPAAEEIPGMIGTEAEGLGRYALELLSGHPMHPDDIAIERMGETLKLKLQGDRAKGLGGLESKAGYSDDALWMTLRDKVEEGDPEGAAILAMLITQR